MLKIAAWVADVRSRETAASEEIVLEVAGPVGKEVDVGGGGGAGGSAELEQIKEWKLSNSVSHWQRRGRAVDTSEAYLNR